MNSQPRLSAIEQKVQAAYQTIHPRASFAAMLRARVDAHARMKKAPTRFVLPFRLAVFGITLILILTAILAAGPQTILARAMSMFGFIPGVGFVEEDNALHLCQPVEVTQNGVTLKIDQAGGSRDELHIIGSVINNPDPNYTYTFGLVDPQGNWAQQLNGGGSSQKDPNGFEEVFRLTSASRVWTLDSARGLSAELEFCPGSQPTNPPEGQQASQPASQPDNPPANPPTTSDSSPTSLPATLYEPSDAVIRGKGMTFKVLQVAQLEETTGIKVEASPDKTNPNPSILDHFYLWGEDVELKDDLGNRYSLRKQNMPGETGSPITSFEFDPFHPEARRAILRIRKVDMDEIVTVPFELDLGGVPQPGQTWDLQGKPGSEYQIKGYTISLLSASYTKEHEQASVFSPVDRDVYVLRFTVQVTPPTKEYSVQSLKMELGEDNYMFYGTSEGSNLLLTANFAHPLTDEPVTGLIGWPVVRLEGPWEIQWELPK